MITIKRKRGEAPKKPEVVVFEEPGIRLKNKTPGLGHAKKRIDERQARLDKKAMKIFEDERQTGEALPSSTTELSLTKALRVEIFELGASHMDELTREKAVKSYKKKHLASHDKLKKQKSDNEYLSYPKYMEKIKEQNEQQFDNEYRRYYGDEMAEGSRKKKARKEKSGVHQGMKSSHINNTKIGKFDGATLKLSKSDLSKIKGNFKR